MIVALKLLSEPVWGDSVIEWVSVVSILALLASALTALYRHWKMIECHSSGCHRIGRFPHGHLRLCARHHPLVPDDGVITQKHIDALSI